jgi:hypothetical protein
LHVAAFVTAHGFGHAGRASAVLDALHERRPDLSVDVFSAVQGAFLDASLRAPHRRIPLASDVGLVQSGPFHTDLDASAAALGARLAGLDEAAEKVAGQLRASRAALVLCDIDALGIVAAARAGVPSVLIENFRWDWIYHALPGAPPGLLDAARRLGEIYPRADLHVQVAPACDRFDGAVQVELPVARAPRASREEARTRLGLAPDERVVLVTMGGVPGPETPLDRLRPRRDVTFLMTGAARTERVGNVLRLAHEEPLYLPDLVRASDAVVAKLGYSTLAETWRQGRPLLRVPRSGWPESPPLSAWADAHTPGFEMDESAFSAGAWLDCLDELLAVSGGPEHTRAGQDEIAEGLLPLLD